MRNPFDQTFFKFLLGFSCILFASFALMFIVGRYSTELSEQEATVLYSLKK